MPLPQGYTVQAKKLPKFHPVPADKYQVQITDITLLEKQLNTFNGKEEDRLNFEFQILDNKNFDYKDEEGEQQIESVRGRKLWKRISPSNSPMTKKSKASWLYKILCAVEKKELGDEIGDLQPNDLIGQQVIVMVEETDTGYNNILAFSAIKEELNPLPPKEEQSAEKQLSADDLSDDEINMAKAVDPAATPEPEATPTQPGFDEAPEPVKKK